ncbi:hypothetical protein [Microvirga terricola]|uniref:Uncharacterized protein n=1 Tax=Microvirga terricola TaxID=2719797 RepID=A0ABX0V7L0_9HYPH|nr:hypothetical protein [Microvirga terricola]NIX75833.1 hypothetical protein [Microvirga terricola]
MSGDGTGRPAPRWNDLTQGEYRTMSRMVLALLKERVRARQALMETGIARDRILGVGTREDREISAISGFRELAIGDNVLAALRTMDLPETEIQRFGEGLRQGLTAIGARIDPGKASEAIRVLQMFDPVDLDRESRDWLAAARVTKPAPDIPTGITGEGLLRTPALPGIKSIVDSAEEVETNQGDFRVR